MATSPLPGGPLGTGRERARAMVRPELRSSRRGVAIAVVLTLLVVAFMGVAAVSYFRSNVTRNLEGQLYDLQLISMGESAIGEVADPARLTELYRGPAGEALLRSFREGKLEGGVLTPSAAGVVEVVPALVREAFGDQPQVEIGAVRVQPMGYMVNLKKGLLRFLVETRIRAPKRSFVRRLCQDHEFSLYETGGQLAVRISKVPSARVYQ